MKLKYRIWQSVPANPNYLKGTLLSKSYELDMSWYSCTYKGDALRSFIACDIKENNITFCEELFRIFNIEQPNNFGGHSMSVTDIVEVYSAENRKEYDKWYFCDDVGWKEITILDWPKAKINKEVCINEQK